MAEIVNAVPQNVLAPLPRDFGPLWTVEIPALDRTELNPLNIGPRRVMNSVSTVLVEPPSDVGGLADIPLPACELEDVTISAQCSRAIR
ncbi:hypothetical protein ACE11G_06080 [Gordonia sp. PS3]|uniref:hypothetical protein n=1 Tax=unclassified Gordonia (in: high G+C Gram-positive bacteria) TaxID=2657482 RepID=UPI0007867E02|nr:hypothetical protein [Gordonia sp. QH-12]KXT57897.1 hypothetical protein Y710_04780 [Gordonia sp. QH-12]